jgi:multicomponent K+:H+ antiporter subunit F
VITTAATIAAVMLGIALLLAGWRLVRGPSAADRILALDTCYVNVLALVVVQGVRSGSPVTFEVAILIALLGFVGTVCCARYLKRGSVID